MTSVNDSANAAVTQNTIPPLKQFGTQGPSVGGLSPSENKAGTPPGAETLDITRNRRSQLESANAFIRELKQSQYVLQVGVSAVQELEEGLAQKEPGKLQSAGTRALQLMESVGRVQVDKDIEAIRRKLSAGESVSFADVVDAVTILARVAQAGAEDGSPNAIQELAEAVGLVNAALSQARGRMEGLTESATRASSQFAEKLNTQEGLNQMSKALLNTMQESKDTALKAQANIDPDFVARVLQSPAFRPN